MIKNSARSKWHLCVVGQLGSRLDQIRLDEQSEGAGATWSVHAPEVRF